MAIVPIVDAAKKAERLLEIVKEVGGNFIPLEGLEDGVLALWQVLEALAAPGDPNDPVVKRNYLAGAGIHDLAAKVIAVWDDSNIADTTKAELTPHLQLLAETCFTGQNVANARWDRKDGVAREHGSADKVIELYWACLSILAGMTVSLDDPIKSSQGKNPDVIAKAADGTRWAFAIKTLAEVASPERAAKNLAENFTKARQQIERASCDKGIVVVNLKNILRHDTIQSFGTFLNAASAHDLIKVEIAKILKPFYLDEAKILDPFLPRVRIAPLIILVAHTTALVVPPAHKPMFTELKTMIAMSLPTPDEHAPGTFGREATMLAKDLNHLVQLVV
jgi:hypothetical protein